MLLRNESASVLTFTKLQICSRGGRMRNFFFYHGFADLLRHIRYPNLVIHTPLSLFATSAIFTG